MRMLLIYKNNDKLKEGYSYIRFQNNQYRPIFFAKDLELDNEDTSEMCGGFTNKFLFLGFRV